MHSLRDDVRVKNAKGEDTVLGRGSYGKVVLMKDAKRNDLLVAVKLLIRSNDSEANNAMREAFQVQTLRHPNIVEIFEAFIVSQLQLQLCTVMEYCKDGDLEAHLAKIKGNPTLASPKVLFNPCIFPQVSIFFTLVFNRFKCRC
jgi:serine/threonine protein kinase